VHSPIFTAEVESPSEAGKRRLLSKFGEPLFLARWDRAIFINYSVDPDVLQRQVPFELDLRNGQAFISLVAFTLVRMRPRIGGAWTEWLLKPIATHEFLNVRTYVCHKGEPGIFFLAEWLSNRISVSLGPRTFGLPYRFGQLYYDHRDSFQGSVTALEGELRYEGEGTHIEFGPCMAGSLDEFMLERYTAFTQRRKRRRLFRIWHSPWPQVRAEIEVIDHSLTASTGAWWKTAELVSANYSQGVDVWMGRPHRIK
jgi:uncharacterized protein YqjF (DUF2071 family)